MAVIHYKHDSFGSYLNLGFYSRQSSNAVQNENIRRKNSDWVST